MSVQVFRLEIRLLARLLASCGSGRTIRVAFPEPRYEEIRDGEKLSGYDIRCELAFIAGDFFDIDSETRSLARGHEHAAIPDENGCFRTRRHKEAIEENISVFVT